MKDATLREIAHNVLIGVILVICLVGAALMLVLPANSLKVDAVYQKF